MATEQRRISGPDSLSDLRPMLYRMRPRRIFLVSGSGSYSRSGAETALRPLLEGYAVRRFQSATHVPDLDEISDGCRRFRKEEPDLVLAVGGGRVIDTAKLINLLSAHSEEPEALIKGTARIRAGGTPLVAVPTTAGSGSEATRFAVVYINGTKHSVDHETLLPCCAIVDPQLTFSMPGELAAATGFDALGQAIESWWSVRSTAASKRLAAAAITLAAGHLRAAVIRGTPDARAAMAEAAHLAGRAIDLTRTTAAHALSYDLTFSHRIPHGHAVALTLGRLLEFNAGVTAADCNDPRGADHVRRTIDRLCALLGCADPAGARRHLRRLMLDCGLSPCVDSLGLDAVDLESVIDSVDRARLDNNPRRIEGRDTLTALFETGPPPRGDETEDRATVQR